MNPITTTTLDRRAVAASGALAGLIAGVGMLIFAMVVSAFEGQGFWFPAELLGATFFGVDAVLGGFGVGLSGIVLGLAVSVVLGLIFSALLRRSATDQAAFWQGLAYGVVAWAVMRYLIIPWANPTMYARVELVRGWYFADFLVFGALLGVTPNLRNRFARVEPPASAESILRAA